MSGHGCGSRSDLGRLGPCHNVLKAVYRSSIGDDILRLLLRVLLLVGNRRPREKSSLREFNSKWDSRRDEEAL